jgi:hypothetical protein
MWGRTKFTPATEQYSAGDPVQKNAGAARGMRKRSSEPSDRMILSIERDTLDQLRMHAIANGTSVSILAASLLEKIAEDELYQVGF